MTTRSISTVKTSHLIAAALVLACPCESSGQSGSVYLGGRNLDHLSLNGGSLFWKSGCFSGVGPVGVIERVPAGTTAVDTYFSPPTCGGDSVRSFNLAVGTSQSVYWATTDGRIVTLPGNATPATAPVTLTSMVTTALPQWVPIAASPAYVYWAETQGEFREGGSLYRVPVGGGTRSLVLNFTQATGGGPVAIHALGNNGVTFGESLLVRRSFGKLTRLTEQLALPGQPSWTEATVVESIDTFSVVGSRVYYAERPTSGPIVIRSRAT